MYDANIQIKGTNHIFLAIAILFAACLLLLPQGALSEEDYPANADTFIHSLTRATDDPDSVFYQAQCTGSFLMCNNWLYGIIGKDASFFVTFLLSDNQPDAIILLARIYIKCDFIEYTEPDAYVDVCYDPLKEIATPLLYEIDNISNFSSNQQQPYGFPIQVEYYRPFSYLGYTLFFYDPQMFTQPRIDGFGNNIQPIIYLCPEQPIGSLRETMGLLISDIDEETIASCYVGSLADLTKDTYKRWNLSEEEFKTLSDSTKKIYRFTDGDYIFEFTSDRYSQVTENIIVRSKELKDADLFHGYLEQFLRISGIQKCKHFIEYLTLISGEQFSWDNYLSRPFCIRSGLIRVNLPSFYIDGWKIVFQYGTNRLPEMTISLTEKVTMYSFIN